MSGARLARTGCLVLTVVFLVALSGFGTDEEGLAALVRFTARVSFALFLPVYTASPLRRLWPGGATRWLLRNRRYLGLCFAWAHGLHGLAIAMLALLLGDAFRVEWFALIGGGLAYLLIAAMALSSNDRAVRRLGPRRWALLHSVGIHWVWVVFAFDRTGLALERPASYWPAAVLVWVAAGLRLVAWIRKR